MSDIVGSFWRPSIGSEGGFDPSSSECRRDGLDVFKPFRTSFPVDSRGLLEWAAKSIFRVTVLSSIKVLREGDEGNSKWGFLLAGEFNLVLMGDRLFGMGYVMLCRFLSSV